jgi:hypothetical protein
MPKNLSHPGRNGSIDHYASITPDDSTDLPSGMARGIFVGIGGAVALRGAAGNEVIVISGDSQYHPLLVTRVLATGTDATNIIALY